MTIRFNNHWTINFNNHWKKIDKFFFFPLIGISYDNCSEVGIILTFDLLGFSIVIMHEYPYIPSNK